MLTTRSDPSDARFAMKTVPHGPSACTYRPLGSCHAPTSPYGSTPCEPCGRVSAAGAPPPAGISHSRFTRLPLARQPASTVLASHQRIGVQPLAPAAGTGSARMTPPALLTRLSPPAADTASMVPSGDWTALRFFPLASTAWIRPLRSSLTILV